MNSHSLAHASATHTLGLVRLRQTGDVEAMPRLSGAGVQVFHVIATQYFVLLDHVELIMSFA